MECRICGNRENNQSFEVKERQHCIKESFLYFQCSKCSCIQISDIPENLAKYYPQDYYSFNISAEQEFMTDNRSGFKKIQSDYLIHGKNKVLGNLLTLGYKHPLVFDWLKNLSLDKNARILDIGCGSGAALKSMYQLGYKNLTGVDPFITKNYTLSNSFHIYKKDPLEIDSNLKFDCIMMHHSFEHMEFEKEVLKKTRSLLNPGGKLLIRIPVFSKPLFEIYGPDLVSLDAPRHLYIHSVSSMELLCAEAGFKVEKVEFDANEFSFWASEEYKKDICLNAENSYARNRKGSIFKKDEIKIFKKKIKQLNKSGESDTAAFYLTPA